MFYKDGEMELYYHKNYTICKKRNKEEYYPFLKYNLETLKGWNCYEMIDKILDLVSNYHQKGKVMGNVNIHTIWVENDQLYYLGECVNDQKGYCDKRYSSPELIDHMHYGELSKKVTYASDIYGIGTILEYYDQKEDLGLEKVIQHCKAAMICERYQNIEDIRKALPWKQNKGMKVKIRDQIYFIPLGNEYSISLKEKKIDLIYKKQSYLLVEQNPDYDLREIYQAILSEIEYSNDEYKEIDIDMIRRYYTKKDGFTTI